MVNATCKVCGSQSPAENYRLHYKYQTVVCPSCFSGKTEKKKQQEEIKKKKESKLPGWDEVDDYLEKSSEVKVSVGKVEDLSEDYLRYSCTKCNFKFKFHKIRKTPYTCPYCDTKVPKIKF